MITITNHETDCFAAAAPYATGRHRGANHDSHRVVPRGLHLLGQAAQPADIRVRHAAVRSPDCGTDERWKLAGRVGCCITPGCQIGYVDHTGRRQLALAVIYLVFFTILPP